MAKRTPFQKLFADPVEFDEGELAIDYEYTFAEAVHRFEQFLDYSIDPRKVRRDKVRYQFVEKSLYGNNGENAGWLMGASGHGSKDVWVYERG